MSDHDEDDDLGAGHAGGHHEWNPGPEGNALMMRWLANPDDPECPMPRPTSEPRQLPTITREEILEARRKRLAEMTSDELGMACIRRGADFAAVAAWPDHKRRRFLGLD